jgi:type II secretion system protein I
MKPRRHAFSLMEIILAIAILVGAMVVLGELARQGLDHARSARDLTQAELICESKLAEIAAGLVTPEPVTETPVEVDPSATQKWLYSVDVSPAGEDGLLAVKVTVSDKNAAGLTGREVSLTRWMIDPEWNPSGETGTGDDSQQVDMGRTSP